MVVTVQKFRMHPTTHTHPHTGTHTHTHPHSGSVSQKVCNSILHFATLFALIKLFSALASSKWNQAWAWHSVTQGGGGGRQQLGKPMKIFWQKLLPLVLRTNKTLPVYFCCLYFCHFLLCLHTHSHIDTYIYIYIYILLTLFAFCAFFLQVSRRNFSTWAREGKGTSGIPFDVAPPMRRVSAFPVPVPDTVPHSQISQFK